MDLLFVFLGVLGALVVQIISRTSLRSLRLCCSIVLFVSYSWTSIDFVLLCPLTKPDTHAGRALDTARVIYRKLYKDDP